jgi:hypothetical protein
MVVQGPPAILPPGYWGLTQPKETKMVIKSPEEFGGPGYLVEVIRYGKEPRSVALCENCGKPDSKPEGLKSCSACEIVWYCNKEYVSPPSLAAMQMPNHPLETSQVKL